MLARDRMGEKPLYLAPFNDAIVFASELKALISAGIVPFELDPAAIHEYFHFTYVPEPRCAVKGVRKLPAGHVMIVDVDAWRVQERCYWRMEDSPPIEGRPSVLIREELERIGELIIRSDVPVGIALSSGVDSSAIAALAARNYPGAMQAFSVGFPGSPVQDERAQAKQLADHLGMPFHSIELTVDEVVREYPTIVYGRDDPIADLGGPNFYTVMKLARAHDVPVMLMGHGGDELFWGYRWVAKSVAASRRKQALRRGENISLRDYLGLTRPPYSYTAAVRWLHSLAGLRTGFGQYRQDKLTPAERMVFYDAQHYYRESARRLPGLYSREFLTQLNGADPSSRFTLPLPWENLDVAITKLICDTYLIENGIAQGDRLAMASSIELRLPLVDYKLVELVIGLRKTQTDSQLAPKTWLREAVADIVPPFVFKRRKRGFTPPWRSWARALASAYGDQMLDGYLIGNGVLQARAAAQLRRRLSPPPFFMPSVLADSAFVLEMWCREMSSRASNAPRSKFVASSSA